MGKYLQYQFFKGQSSKIIGLLSIILYLHKLQNQVSQANIHYKGQMPFTHGYFKTNSKASVKKLKHIYRYMKNLYS